ncbi:MAG: phospholipase, partial [Acidobacteriaceae bacterium]|nr:phospholipase [Acidobacteriaceae bacterium]
MVEITGAIDLPPANSSGIEHVVVVTMENRSFDHFLGWLPGANGKQQGLKYPDHNNVEQSTWQLTNFEECGYNDPDHSYSGSRV